MRTQLEAQRDSARSRITELAEPPELGDAQGFGKRIGDGTVEAISRLTEIGVGESLEDGLARTERALEKLGDGTYGNCDQCGQSIAAARLKAMADSVLCIDCASSQHLTRPPRRR